MKRFLTPRNILILVLVVAAFFVIRNQLRTTPEVLVTGSKGGECPVHDVRLRLDTVPIAVQPNEPDSLTAAHARTTFPHANDTFYILQWFKDDEHKNLSKAEVWYCPACREAKSY